MDRERILHVARLARLALTPEEVSRLGDHLATVLAYVAKLSELDTSQVEPTASGLEAPDVTRPDDVAPCLPAAEALAQAPDASRGCFLVPRIPDE